MFHVTNANSGYDATRACVAQERRSYGAKSARFRWNIASAIYVSVAAAIASIAGCNRGAQPSESAARAILSRINAGCCEFHGDPVTSISFCESDADEDTLRLFKSFPHLQRLTLAYLPNVTNRGMDHLVELTQLTELRVIFMWIRRDEVARLKALTHLRKLELGETLVDDRALEQLSGLSDMEELSLGQTLLTDGGLKYLRGMSKLKILSLSGEISDKWLEQLGGLTHIKDLALYSYTKKTPVTDNGLAFLANMNELQTLSLWNSQVCGFGLKHLHNCQELRKLRLPDSKVCDEGLPYLKGFPALEYLDLSGSNITDAGLAQLEDLSHLKRLDLTRTKITDAGLGHLKTLVQLQDLYIESTQATRAGLADLRKALHYTKVTGRGRDETR